MLSLSWWGGGGILHLFMIPIPFVFPHDSPQSSFLAASSYHSAYVEGCSHIRSLIEVSGYGEFLGRCFHDFSAIVVVNICSNVTVRNIHHQSKGKMDTPQIQEVYTPQKCIVTCCLNRLVLPSIVQTGDSLILQLQFQCSHFL